METITGYVDHIIFRNEDNGYTITVDNDNDTIRNIEIAGGCPGNLLGITHLLKGMKVDEVIERFDGVPCGLKTTSCPDQIARALKAYKQKS